MADTMRGPKFPLTAALPRGRVRHSAKLVGDGPRVMTLCGKLGVPTGNGEGLAWCAACANKPNPQDQRSYNYS